jgi:hypothetical protein
LLLDEIEDDRLEIEISMRRILLTDDEKCHNCPEKNVSRVWFFARFLDN